MIIQYGYIVLFSCAFPLAPLASLLNNIVEIKFDGYNFLTQSKRMDYEGAKDIGSWMFILKILSYLGVVTNVCIIAFTDKSFNLWRTPYQGLVIAFIIEV